MSCVFAHHVYFYQGQQLFDSVVFQVVGQYFLSSSRILDAWRTDTGLYLACVAGVQRGGRGEVECEREARRENERPTIALRARIQLPPSLPFYAGHAG